MATSPAFQFYPADWLSDANVKAMSLEEKGAYIELLATAWREEKLPSDPHKLARILGVSMQRFGRIWNALEPCWTSDGNGGLVNPRLEAEREKQARWRAKSVKGGKASGKARAKQS